MTAPRYYAGIGSRETPSDVEPTIRFIAEKLDAHGFVLRSGAAPGADSMFEAHASKSEIFLPWRRYMQHASPLHSPSPRAFEIAARVHPAWDKCSQAARKLHARNVHIVLGQDLATPIEFVVCWTPKGHVIGGTATALRIAINQLDVPDVNLFFFTPLLRPLLDARIDAVIARGTRAVAR